MSKPDVLNEDFVKGLPDKGPVVMLNLLRFRAGRLQWRSSAVEGLS